MARKVAICTLIYSRDYLPGALTLAYQLQKLLKHAVVEYQITVCLLIESKLFRDEFSPQEIALIRSLFKEIIIIEPLKDQEKSVEKNKANLELLKRPELSHTLLKARLWELVQFDQVLFLDADTLPLNKEFFRILQLYPEQTRFQIAAVPDIGWPDMFNTGVLLLIPDLEMARSLQNFLVKTVSIDGADQGIFNQFFNPICNYSKEVLHNVSPLMEWIRLPFIYNVTMPNYGYQSSPAMSFFQQHIKLIHFIGAFKPWSHTTSDYNDHYYQLWRSTQCGLYGECHLSDYFTHLQLGNIETDTNFHHEPPCLKNLLKHSTKGHQKQVEFDETQVDQNASQKSAAEKHDFERPTSEPQSAFKFDWETTDYLDRVQRAFPRPDT
ncbi:glycogenin glucosyltransferase GLG2 [Saccharomyces paradoxus]|uniref:glycogenin glucosyltransferase n=1 Tax=Saccharomyces paradoxus TaxID=27291 RepID=A0A8B8UTS3_SACPA|nr:Glg2 [Saccharomyces paradoxus]QHS74122.1 Glg2 [Saccharomyces paradoxus]